MRVSIVVAMTRQNLIGKGGNLPWHIPEDLQHFKRTTLGHAVVMGRKTLEQMKKPLKGRRNMVITRNPHPPEIPGVEWFGDLPAALQAAQAAGETDCMIIGGGEIYRTALELDMVDRMVITWITLTPEPTGDTYFPTFDRARWGSTETFPVGQQTCEIFERTR